MSEREVGSPGVTRLLLYALIVVTLWNMETLWLAQDGNSGWWGDVPLFQEGLEYIEGGRITDVLVLAGFMMFGWIVYRTLPPRRTWNEFHWGVALGVAGLVVVWIFGFLFFPEVDKQEYFRWYVVHFWVEAVWEVIHITLVGFLLMKMFGASQKVAGYAVFWGVSLVWLSGLIGNGHHYFWIGTPEFWQFWGSFFSALEPLPIILCFWHIYLDSHHDAKPVANMPAFLFLLGSATFELAGVRRVAAFNQRLGVLSFWLMFIGIIGVATAFAFGGTVQVYVYRILGLDWFGAEVHTAMLIWKTMLAVFAIVFLSTLGHKYTHGHRITTLQMPRNSKEKRSLVEYANNAWNRYCEVSWEIVVGQVWGILKDTEHNGSAGFARRFLARMMELSPLPV